MCNTHVLDNQFLAFVFQNVDDGIEYPGEEMAIVHPTMLGKLHRFLEEIEAVVMPFDEQQARLADATFQRFGKGQKHPAQLNLGDCAVYALAKSIGEPLLFVGNDFAQTDIESC
jgi:ribonuclease VapC